MTDRIKFIPEELHNHPDLEQALAMPSADFLISQASLVDSMVELLDVQPGQKILEVGAGTGYHAAVMAEKGAKVFSVERLLHAFEFGSQNISNTSTENVTIIHGDGFAGLPDNAPFDRISVACAVSGFPWELFEQLKVGGILLYPASVPGSSNDFRPDILLRIQKNAEIDRGGPQENIKAAMKIEQIETVKFMPGSSDLLPTSNQQYSYGDENHSGIIHDIDNFRPDISFLELSDVKDGGPPLHYHKFEDEGFYVLEGEFDFVVGGKHITLKKGEFLVAPRETPHKYTAKGDGQNRMYISLTPSGGERYFIDENEILQRDLATEADLKKQ